MKKIMLWLVLLCLFAPAALAENVSFSGTVVAGETVEVYAFASALVEKVYVKAGQQVTEGDSLAALATTKVYAPLTGVVAARFADPGDDAATAATLWGSVLLLDENVTFTVSADIEKAYDSLETQSISPGETVYLQARSDDNRTGTGIVTAVDNTAYTVKGTAGDFIPGETVEVFRTADLSSKQCLGRGSVVRTAPTAVTAEGTIVSVAATAGNSVQKGDLLLETLSGTADSPLVTAPVSGMVAQVLLTQGSSATDGSAAFVLYPEGALQSECNVPAADLGYLAVGDRVSISFLWNEETSQPMNGTVESISAIPQEGTTTYTATIAFEPDETVRYGMTVTVTSAE